MPRAELLRQDANRQAGTHEAAYRVVEDYEKSPPVELWHVATSKTPLLVRPLAAVFGATVEHAVPLRSTLGALASLQALHICWATLERSHPVLHAQVLHALRHPPAVHLHGPSAFQPLPPWPLV